ncbi:DUF1553 domain-containing protein [Neorhodopirellula pilleata]|uniref:Planctomycete cytochrome C n=1 Tax=Neorhodopirellula pilleata TaxID=2714738 RepID=A0A5C5ZQ02_9BACT|nr:DUF1553 domain-containing protein [Neorhodopirellula pilleata]TWT89564.1 Planctomycete cytochrome C [Neorhodopirellula pilleata]
MRQPTPSSFRRCLSGSLIAIVVGSFSILIAAEPDASAPNPEHVSFFESRIRPVLVQHCYECHSDQTDDVAGSLWLDSAGGMKDGGDSGPAIVPGDVDGSLLISAIRYESSEMPPSGRLPDPVIEDFEKWIRDGAVDPRSSADLPGRRLAPSGIDLEEGRKFWAFQPVRSSTIPVMQADQKPADSWIDAFLNDALSHAGIIANEDASIDAQLRRLSFDLTGLPPSEDLIESWRSDPSERHWMKIVDELLASSEFAEHWARHEMDVARYADSNGADFNATHHDAWRYRDYLVRSIARDVPIDETIRQQIAGDLLPFATPEQQYDQLVATTFLMIGTKMLSERNKTKLIMDVVDEQIDTVGRAFMALTLGCARCHDHKFDPVATEDYYALAGIFRSTRSLEGESQRYVSTWRPTPLPASPDLIAAHAAYDAKTKELQQAIKKQKSELESLQAPQPALEGVVIDDREAVQDGQWTESTYMPGFIGEGYVHDNNRDKGERSIQFQTALPAPGDSDSAGGAATKIESAMPTWEVRLWYSPGTTRAANIPATIQIGEQTHELTIDQRQSGNKVTFLVLGRWKADYGSELRLRISNHNTTGYVVVDALQIVQLDESQDDQAAGPDSDRVARIDSIRQQRQAAFKNEIKRLEDELTAHKKIAPERLPHAMAVADLPASQCRDCEVHIRGEINNLGEPVPRGFLRVCGNGSSVIQADPSSGPLSQSSGRLELADWLTDPDHPLTARVSVNRIWMHLMGEGIVRTVDNFGSRGERPAHPELLDALAIELIRSGWSRKQLIRQIVLTNAYRRSSQDNPDAASIDPENRLLWRAHRRRLTAESIRDAMLVVSGTLDRSPRYDTMRSYGVLVSNNNADSKANKVVTLADPKRTIYLPIIRGEIPTLLSTLDAADPDLLVGKRPTTNVPAQAFALIGSDEVRHWAKLTAQRLVNEVPAEQDRVEPVYRRVLQRFPQSADRDLVNAWMNSPAASEMDEITRWQYWIAAMFAGTEFRFLD